MVRVDPDTIDSLNSNYGVEQRAGDNEVVERCFAACWRFGRADHTINKAKKARSSESIWWHVPVASDGPRALEDTKGGSSALTDQLVGRVHAHTADEIERHEMYADP